MRILTFLADFITWYRVFISPLLMGLVGGYVFYGVVMGTTGLVGGICIASMGFVLGVAWANHVWKKYSDTHYNGKVRKRAKVDSHQLSINSGIKSSDGKI